jgi:hypothetical protein
MCVCVCVGGWGGMGAGAREQQEWCCEHTHLRSVPLGTVDGEGVMAFRRWLRGNGHVTCVLPIAGVHWCDQCHALDVARAHHHSYITEGRVASVEVEKVVRGVQRTLG